MNTARPVQTPAPADTLLRLQAVVAADAEARHTTGTPSHALLVVELHTGKGLPYRVQQDLGTDPAAHLAAGAKAQLLRRGARVTATARGLAYHSDHDRAYLRLVDVTDLIPHDIPTCSAAR